MPKRDLTGWTLGTYVAHNEALWEADRQLRQEIDRRYQEQDKANQAAVKAALAAAEKAADKTEAALKEYKIASNEWRDTVKDLVNRIPSRSEIETKNKALEERIYQQGKNFDVTLKPVLEYIAADRGRTAGVAGSWSVVLGAAALVASLIAIGSYVFRSTGASPSVVYVPSPPGTLLPSTPPQTPPR